MGEGPRRKGGGFSWITVRDAGEERLRAGHPWIFRGHILDGATPMPGALVGARNSKGRTLAWGFWSSGALCFRALDFGDTPPLLEDVLCRRLQDALTWRRIWYAGHEAFRWVHGEGDQLSGLVVDLYGDVASLQLLTAGWYERRFLVVEALKQYMPLRGIVLRNDSRHLERECLRMERGLLWGELPHNQEAWISMGALREVVPLLEGQKTGIYLDVQDVPSAIAPAVADARVLDVFSFQGHFGLHTLHNGAREVVAVEQSPDALARGRQNREQNGLPDRVTWIEGNAFDILRHLEGKKERFRVVIMDPPPFAPGKDRIDGARRGYKELALRSFRLLEDQGTLLFLCCSHAFSPELLLTTLAEAARDAGVDCRVAAEIHQPADHPISPVIPESRYFHGFILGIRR